MRAPLLAPMFLKPSSRPFQPIYFGNASADSPTDKTAAFLKSLKTGDLAQFQNQLAQLDLADIQNPQQEHPMQILMHHGELPLETAFEMMSALLKKGVDADGFIRGAVATPLRWALARFSRNPDKVVTLVDELLTAGANIDSGQTPSLHPLATFMERGIDAKDKPQATALLKRMLAAKPNLLMLERSQVLLQAARGTRLDPSDLSGTSPRGDWLEALELLIDYGLKPGTHNWAILQVPMLTNLPQTYQFLRTRIPPEEVMPALSFLLDVANSCQRPEIMRLVLKEPLDFKKSPYGNPQHWLEEQIALTVPLLDIMRMMIEAGANPSQPTRYNKEHSALHEACSGLAEYRLAGYATGTGNRVLEWTDGVEVLLECPGINLDVADFNGETPLMIAAHKGFIGVIRLLLEAGANPTLENTWGETAWNIVNERSDIEPAKKRMLLLLLERASQSWPGASNP